jgi:hypothetical protein
MTIWLIELLRRRGSNSQTMTSSSYFRFSHPSKVKPMRESTPHSPSIVVGCPIDLAICFDVELCYVVFE